MTASAIFERKTTQSVTEMLARRVVEGEWGEGQPLPSEPELALELGVARTSVREALMRIKAKGLLVSRTKTGTRVLPRLQWNMLDEDVLRWVWSGQDKLAAAQHLMQLRRIVEPAAAESAASIAEDTAIASIERAYHNMDAAGLDRVAYAGPDLEFHRAIWLLQATPFWSLLAMGLRQRFACRLSFLAAKLALHVTVCHCIELYLTLSGHANRSKHKKL